MFIEKLTKRQYIEYLNTVPGYCNLTENDIEIKLSSPGFQVLDIIKSKKPKFITVTDNYIIDPANKSWCRYLYSIFGDEYKNWYVKKLKDEFEMIFESN